MKYNSKKLLKRQSISTLSLVNWDQCNPYGYGPFYNNGSTVTIEKLTIGHKVSMGNTTANDVLLNWATLQLMMCC